MSPLTVLVFTCALAAAAHGAAFKEAKLGETVEQKPARLGPLPTGLDQPRSDLEVGGQDTKLGQFPHQASIQVTMPGFWWWDAAPQHHCSGTLVAANWVLTSAACAHGVPKNARKVEVVLGIDNLAHEARGKQRIRVSRTVVHAPSGPFSAGSFDIALLELAKAATLTSNIQLAVLPSVGSLPSGDAVFSGWGRPCLDEDQPEDPNQLRADTFPVLDYKDCVTSPSFDGTALCVATFTLDPNGHGLFIRRGDGGGPLVQQDDNGRAVVIGVMSWGAKDCGREPYPSVFANTAAYVEWIQGVLQQGANAPAGFHG